MKYAITVCLLACAILFLPAKHVAALQFDQPSLKEDSLSSYLLAKKSENPTPPKPVETKKADEVVTPEPVAPPVVVTYTVVSGDSLSTIATAHQTDWKRIFNKNVEIANPDIISAGQVLTIPNVDEQLIDRPLPLPTPVVVATPNAATSTQTGYTSSRTAVSQTRGSSSGNTYAPGYCTWYAKSRRPDLPNRMGNAISWVTSASAQGFATGSTPQVGAIGQRGNHVVYVEAVNGDGTVTISEMNYQGLYVVSSRTVAASSFTYIY